MHRRITTALLALVVWAPFSCTNQTSARDESESSGASGKLPRVVVQNPEPTNAEETLRFPGTFEAYQDVAVYARITGYVEELNVDIGTEVKDGDPIARLTVPALQANLREARANVSAAEADLRAAKERLNAAKVTSDRLSKLKKDKPGAVPDQKVDVARADRLEAKAQVRSAKASIQEAKARVRELRSRRGFSVVRAPFDGVVVKRHTHVGALVREGTASTAQPLVEVARHDKLRYSFQIPETLAPHVGEGDTIQITPEVMPDHTIEAKITRTSEYLDRETRTERAEVDLTDLPEQIQPGMIGDVTLTARRFEGALELPSSAVRGSGQDRYALVVEEGKIVKKSVTIGLETGARTVVVDGLSKSDRVMTSGSKLATPGQKVRVANAE